MTPSSSDPSPTHTGWRPLRVPEGAGLLRHLADSPYGRLALTHALAVAGDTLVTMALAGSVFFSVRPDAARTRVALYLVLTMAPFALVAPFLGPVLDRSRTGRRAVVIATGAARAFMCLSMARHLKGLLLFPEAFVVLVLSKSYTVTKGALVPGVVEEEGELVEANSKLAIIAVLAGFVAAVPGVITLKVGFLGAAWTLRTAAVVFALQALAAVRISARPKGTPAPPRPDLAALRTAGIRLAASAMAVLRGSVGFFTFLVAFAFRRAHTPSWWYGVALAASLGGSLVGALVAPRLRRWLVEEHILIGSLVAVAVVGLAVASSSRLAAATAMAATIGIAAQAGKLSFDSIVQRDAPDAARGHSFARFETRFQLAWVLSALIPVIVSPLSHHLDAGLVVLSGASIFAVVSYVGSRRVLAHGGGTTADAAPAAPDSVGR